MKRSVFFLIAVVVFCSGGALVMSPSWANEHAHEHGKAVYTCPMHPSYTSDRPGSCPICGMNLVKKESVDGPASKGVMIDLEKQKLVNIRKEAVGKKPLSLEIRASGRVAYDPELYAAQIEYIAALKSYKIVKSESVRIPSQATRDFEAAKRKLRFAGMSDEDIEGVGTRRLPENGLLAGDTLDTVWVYALVYENEMALVKVGQKVALESVAFPGEAFDGVVAGISPVVDPQAHGVRVRIRVVSEEKKLRPEMIVTARIIVDLGFKLAVPAQAVLDSGTRKIVYIVENDVQFVARDVEVGRKAVVLKTAAQGEYYEVLSGLREGEAVVSDGNFLVDAESRLKSAF
ncbi:MAG: efflux RND transporter periplasmic adaptor subunit [Candidatus Omnitrophica bacterium]|nr:efflux RND transporter periplasmic adaptor subunit [Candidatus Omnitrophota bacterium]